MTTALVDYVQDTLKTDAEHEKAFLAIAREFAQGDRPETDRVNAALANANKTTADLEAAVDAITERIAWRAELDRQPIAERERTKLDSKIAKLDEKLEQAERDHDAAVYPLAVKRDDLSREIQAGDSAKSRLINSVLDPDWLARRRACRDNLTVVEADLREANKRCETARAKAEQPESETFYGEAHKTETERAAKRLIEHETNRDELQQQRESLLDEMRGLEDEALHL